MALFVLSDLHLSFAQDKPMDIFGPMWLEHDKKITENWHQNIKEEDTILLGGDLSWSLKMEDAKQELDYIASLPGRKIAIKGNHDLWWSSVNKLNKLYSNFFFLQNNFYSYKDYAICGSRGWISEGSEKFTSSDEKIYKREILRLRMSLDAAKKSGFEKIIVMIHYPPVNEKGEKSLFTELFEEYKVETVLYGHLHGRALKNAFTGVHNGINYILTSGDFLDFMPLKLMD